MAERRPKGTGSIRNRGTQRAPRWFARYYVVVDGERRQVQEGPFALKADAEAWLRDQLQRAREGRAVVPGKVTVAEVLDDWLAVARPRLSPNTWIEYERAVRLRLRPVLGHHRLSELRPGHIAAMHESLRRPDANLHASRPGRALSETTIQHVHATLHTALEWAVRQRLLARNPAADVDRPRRAATEMSVWTAGELAGFLAHAAGDRLAPLWHLAAFSGMRRSELLGLRWGDVDLAAATVSVRRVRIRVGRQMSEQARTKSRRGTRVVDVDPETVAVLRRCRAAQRAERLAWGPGYETSESVFTAPGGRPLHADQVGRRFTALVAAAPVPAIRFHEVRHTHASLLLAAGVPSIDVAGRIGDSLATLESTYAHVIPRRGHQAATAFAGIVGSHTGP